MGCELSFRYILATTIGYGLNTGIYVLPRITMMFRDVRLRFAWELIQEIDVKLSTITEETCDSGRRIVYASAIATLLVSYVPNHKNMKTKIE